jgi:hydroxypyruvate isomerase
MAFKQSVSTGIISGLPENELQQILQIGITGLELTPVADLAKWRDRGFAIASIGGHKSLQDGLNKKENYNRIVDEIRANLEAAKEFDVSSLICLSGNREGRSDEEGKANTIEILKTVAPDAEAAGVFLVMELLNSYVNHPDYHCDSTPWGVDVVMAVNSPRVKLLYDVYHMQIMEGDLIRTIQDNHQHFAHYHTAGNPGRQDLDDQQEIYYPAVARAIRDTGFTGWVGHEYRPKGNVVDSLREAFEACDV